MPRKVWDLLSTSGLAVVDAIQAGPESLASTEPLPTDIGDTSLTSLPGRAEFASLREALLDAVAARVATSPTALVKAEQVKPEPVDETEPRKYPRRGSSKGAAIGTAVHRVLELVDLANPTEDEIIRLTELACAESEIPALVKDVAGRVASALHADVVEQAGESGRAWREVYLIVRDGDRYVEGYIDLLAEPSDGKLVVVDYKTDRVDSPDDVGAKEAYYAPQLAQYQSAIRAVVGSNDVTAQLVFAAPAPKT